MKPVVGTHIRWAIFRAMDRIARRGTAAPATPAIRSADTQPAVWLFVSTIGELHAVEPLIRAVERDTGSLRWVVLTDRRVYREAYQLRFPAAEIIEIGDDLAEAPQLAARFRPELFLIAEIPLMPSDAPCRLGFQWIYEAASAGAFIAVVNGWPYGYAPSCRSDAVERRLLGPAWFDLIDRFCVQTQEAAALLISAGAAADRVVITGNIKFDAMDRQSWSPDRSRSPQLLKSLASRERAVVVAGCVTDAEEQELILDAFVLLRSRDPGVRLILAPRHPENPAVMQALAEAATVRHIRCALRSAVADTVLGPEIDCLILDTMGELRDFYAVADVAHVGRDHNILEPLAFGRPVSVRSGWNPTYPSYPVFSIAKQNGGVHIADHPDMLSGYWATAVEARTPAGTLPAWLEAAQGATQKHLDALHLHDASGREAGVPRG